MAWYDGLLGATPGATDDERANLARGGLLQAGLGILSANAQPGVAPIQAITGGLLGGINSAQQGARQLQDDKFQQQRQQFAQAQMADQQDQMQRRRELQDGALPFVVRKPDGTTEFDHQGYQTWLMGKDPQAALELHQNEIQARNAELQGQKTQRDLQTPVTDQIVQGNQVVTRQLQPDGSMKVVGTGSRFAPTQASETDRQIAAFRKLGATDDQIKAKFGLVPASSDTDLTPEAIENMAWDKVLTGANPQYSRGKSGDVIRNQVNNRVAEIAKTAGVSAQELATVQGRNKAIQSSLAYTQKNADALDRQEETFEANFGNMLKLGQRVSRTGIPAFNKMLLNAKSNIAGDPDTAAFLTARNLAAQEYAKIAMGATGAGGTTDSAREHALEAINSAQTPEQLEAVHAALQQDIRNQKQANIDKLNDLNNRKMHFGSTVVQPSSTATLPSAASHSGAPSKYMIGQVISANGKKYKVTGVSNPEDPDVVEIP